MLDPEELLREAEEQAGDDGGEQVACSPALQCNLGPTEFLAFTMLCSTRLHDCCAGAMQVLLDARGLKRLILSFERKVRRFTLHRKCF